MNAINYRIIDDMDDIIRAEHLQQTVWGMTPLDTLSATTMCWMIHIGGLLMGAWDGDQLVGFCIGSPGKREGKWVFWSDMAGIHPDYQGRGMGYELKIRQREWVKQQGYDEIRWTFDPMQRGNAAFNFHKLGVISYLYHPKFYGEMKDNINIGLPADRLEAIWSTTDQIKSQPNQLSHIDFVVEASDEKVQVHKSDNPVIGIQIPYNLSQLKSTNLPFAVEWQKAVREAFISYFKAGYRATDFVKKDSDCWYILTL